MIKIILPDGKQLEFAKPVTVQEIAQAIGAGLAKAAIAGKVDGKAVDLSCLVERDAVVMILTSKNPEGGASFISEANLTNPDVQIMVGSKGSAIVYGEEVRLGYWLIRKPLAGVRSLLGI